EPGAHVLGRQFGFEVVQAGGPDVHGAGRLGERRRRKAPGWAPVDKSEDWQVTPPARVRRSAPASVSAAARVLARGADPRYSPESFPLQTARAGPPWRPSVPTSPATSSASATTVSVRA